MNKEELFQYISEKPFILGIGSQRAGSTLLSQVLSEAHSIYMHPVKELHYFDTINEIRPYHILREFAHHQLNILTDAGCGIGRPHALNTDFHDAVRSHYLSFKVHPSKFNYRQHFLAVASRQDESLQYYAENTPEYQLLPVPQLKRINNLFKTLKVILMVRNPVKRIFSSMNLLLNYSNFSGSDEEFIQKADFIYDDNSGWMRSQNHFNDYLDCIHRLEEAGITPLVLGFDDFINNPALAVQKLSDYLELDLSSLRESALFTKRVNAVKRNLSYPPEMYEYINAKYAKNTEEIQNYLGSTLLQ